MKAKIKEIRIWYNDKGETIQYVIVYKSGKTSGYLEKLPKTAEKWMKEALLVRKDIIGKWTYKVYREKM